MGTVMFELSLGVKNVPLILSDFIDGDMSSALSPMPVATHSTAYAMYGDSLYYCGGVAQSGKVSTTYAYDFKSNQYRALAGILGGPRDGATLCQINNKLYLFAGSNTAGSTLKEIIEYDPVNNSWVVQTGLTVTGTYPSRFLHTAQAVDGVMYIFGGFSGSAQLKVIEAYNPVAKTVTTLDATLDQERHGHISAVWGKKILIFGGITKNTNVDNVLQEFDTVTRTIRTVATTGDTPPARAYGMMDVYKDHLYLHSGLSTPSAGQLEDLYRLDLSTMVWTKLVINHLPGSVPSGNGLAIHGIWRNQMHIVGGYPAGSPVDRHYYFT